MYRELLIGVSLVVGLGLAGCVSVRYPTGPEQWQAIDTSRPFWIKVDVVLDVKTGAAGGATTSTIHLETHADPDPAVQLLREAAVLAGKGAAAGALAP